MSQSRVGTDDAMVVDEARVDPPTNEWLEAAQRATDTDGILENASAKRQKVCISCHTLTSPAHANHAQECTQRRESLQETRVRVARSCKTERKEEEHPKGQLRLTSALPPKSLPNPSRITAVSLPWHCRGTAVALPCTMRSSSLRSPREAAPNDTHQNGIRTPDPGQDARGEAHWTALQGLPLPSQG